MRSFIFLLVFCFSSSVLVQAQTETPRPVSKVVEIETDIEADQIRASDRVDKPTIKPRVDYFGDKKDKMKVFAADRNEKMETKAAVNIKGEMSQAIRPKSDDRTPSSGEQDGDDPTGDAVSQAPPEEQHEPAEVITDTQVVAISASLRKLIEENNKLKDQIAGLDEQLKTARGQQKLDSKRLSEVALERDALRQQNQNIITLGSQSDEKLQALQKELSEKEQSYHLQIVRLQTELAQKLRENHAVDPQASAPASVPSPAADPKRSIAVNVVSASAIEAKAITAERSVENRIFSTGEAKQRGEKVLLALRRVSEEKQKLMHDEARVHYNMGNNFYNQGDYVHAAAEYKKTLDLTPEDASAHYNLAFVSDEYLNDPKAALNHYREYLFFNPRAEDAVMVQQKIIEAETLVKGDVNFHSSIGREVQSKKNEVNQMLGR